MLQHNPCTKGIGRMLGGHNCLGKRPGKVCLMLGSVLRTARCAGVAFAQTGRISRSHRLWRRTFALVAPVLPGSWVSLPIAGRATTVLEFCLT